MTAPVRSPPALITPAQLRAARVLLGLRQEDLAAMAGMAVGTINGAEAGAKATRPLTLKVLAEVLTEAGVEFLPDDAEFGPGVRLREGRPTAAGRPGSDA